MAVSEEKNPGARKAGLIFQQPFSLPENAQTVTGIAFRAAGKSVNNLMLATLTLQPLFFFFFFDFLGCVRFFFFCFFVFRFPLLFFCCVFPGKLLFQKGISDSHSLLENSEKIASFSGGGHALETSRRGQPKSGKKKAHK